ncbi:ArsR/SmtB family transcription factor [Erythrobacter sp. GH1-10]|uniref:ArsR/SmtB family transcription factor n=1 Tax=Erythrobacter sp. GH1-10 TaxID=3349334 RepID=UPI003877CF62
MGVPFDPNLSKLFRALGDDTRLLILEQLRERDDQSLFEICARLVEQHDITLTRQAITRHLNTLEEAGLISTAWRGRTKVHSLTADPLEETVHPWLQPYFGE